MCKQLNCKSHSWIQGKPISFFYLIDADWKLWLAKLTAKWEVVVSNVLIVTKPIKFTIYNVLINTYYLPTPE